MPLIVDSHLDLAWNALSWKRDLTLSLAEVNRREQGMDDRRGRGAATTTLPEMRRAGVAVCLATLMARVPTGKAANVHDDLLDYPSQEIAHGVARGQLAYYRQLERSGQVAVLESAEDLEAHWSAWHSAAETDRPSMPLGLIVAMEGCDAVVTPHDLSEWRQLGLRCISLVHYGRGIYAVGTGDDGPLTNAGRSMLHAMQRLSLVLDVTHLSDQSFWEAIDVYTGPLIASHQNCRSLVPGQRQFSDEQIRVVIQRDGVVGAALDAWMLYPGWVRGPTDEESTSRSVVSMDAVADHIDHVCQLAGNCRHVAIGSDLDGGFGTEQTPMGLDSIRDLGKLEQILAGRGFSDSDVAAVMHGNWLRFFREHLPPKAQTTPAWRD